MDKEPEIHTEKKQRIDPSSPMDISPEVKNVGFGNLNVKMLEEDQHEPIEMDIDALIQVICDPNRKMEAITNLKLLFSKGHIHPIQEATKESVVSTLFLLLADASIPNLQGMILSVIADIALVKPNSLKTFLENGAIDEIVNFINSDATPKIQDEVVRALGNIASYSMTNRFLVINAGLVQLLNLFLKTPPSNASLLRMLQWTLLVLYSGTAPPNILYKDVILAVKDLLLQPHEEHTIAACRTISFLTNDASSEIVSLVINSEASLCKSLVDLLKFPQSRHIMPTLEAVKNAIQGNQTQKLFDSGLLPLLLSIIEIGNKQVYIREACRIISVIAATKNNVQALMDEGFMASLVVLTMAGQDIEKDTKKEAALAIADIAKYNNIESPEAEPEDPVE